jgi:putative oxidoreductase
MTAIAQVVNLVKPINKVFDFLTPLLLLGTRLWVAMAFFKAGLVKIQSFDTTLVLFENEYHVPIISPTVAAYMGTFTELFFPVLLALGLGGRFTAIILFVFNIIAVISYPDLQVPGLKDHELWGFMLAVLVFYGPGKLSLDEWLAKKFS